MSWGRCFLCPQNFLVRWLEEDYYHNYTPLADWVQGVVRQTHRPKITRRRGWGWPLSSEGEVRSSHESGHGATPQKWEGTSTSCFANVFGDLLCETGTVLSVRRQAS